MSDEEQITTIQLTQNTREKLKVAMLKVQGRIERELNYDEFILWALKEMKLD